MFTGLGLYSKCCKTMESTGMKGHVDKAWVKAINKTVIFSRCSEDRLDGNTDAALLEMFSRTETSQSC